MTPLDRHNVIEASAGTGKTYTIEQLVLRMLKSGVALTRILLVTYTEKAAAEMKERVRRAIEDDLETCSAPERELLNAALEVFDDAQIFTIHAFCLRVLQQFPFDHGYGTRGRMVRDADIREICLRQIQRTAWPQSFGKNLAPVLEIGGFAAGRSWEEKLQEIAGGFRPLCQHELLPGDNIDAAKEPAALVKDIQAAITKFKKCLGPLLPVENNPVYAGYATQQMNARSRAARQEKILRPIIKWVASADSLLQPVEAFLDLIAECRRTEPFNEDSFGALGSKLESGYTGVCACLTEIAADLDRIKQRIERMQHTLTVETVKRMLEQVEHYKGERGLQSFEDMLTRVRLALEKPALLNRLRELYTYGIVDEFQDTDPVQWEIFKRIFVDGKDQQRFLFLVGDPKQAIYGFRNADVETYKAARDFIRKKTQAQPATLDTNWRSCAELLRGLNHLFGEGHFFAEDAGFKPVKPVGDALKRPTVVAGADHSGRKALTLVNISAAKTFAEVKAAMAEFTAAEIQRLLHGHKGGPAFQFRRRQETRGLRPDDIAVLVFRRGEARAIEDALRRRQIPYSFYKKLGVWQSDEALHLGYVLKALARPEQTAAQRKMLLTRFFGIKPEEIVSFEAASAKHPLRQLLACLRNLARKRQWAELFRALQEDTGALYCEAAAHDGERRLANYRHLTHALAREAYDRGLDILDLAQLLDENRRNSGEEETGLQPLETERATVKVMTVHACKGLEFPVVFLAGGYAGPRPPKFWKYHNEEKHLSFDLRDDDDAKARDNRERDQEDRRLLYVALTRAMFKLYLPNITADVRRPWGPTKAVLAQALATAAPQNAIPDCAAECEPITTGPVLIETSPPPAAKVAPDAALFPQADIAALLQRRFEVQSFSRIVHHRDQSQGVPLGEETVRNDDDGTAVGFTRDDLPAGKAAGQALHDAIEKLDFAKVAAAESLEKLRAEAGEVDALLQECLTRHLPGVMKKKPDGEKCLKRAADLLWNTLRTPLKELGGDCLALLPEADRLHELEFKIPFWLRSGSKMHLPEVLEGVRISGDFLTGFMDIVFKHRGRYYLADWKSNLLAAGYSRAALHADMQARRYDLQYRIYLQALLRWLTRAEKNFDAQKQFGGVFYFYLRGMSAAAPDEGVYFHRPAQEDFDAEKLRHELQDEMFQPKPERSTGGAA